jgi:mannose-6-phosphate isomerase-like protein (cupin superfamily)
MKNDPSAKPTISESISVVGKSLVIHEWEGSGPDYMHVHYEDDEAWHVLEGTLTFQFIEETVEAKKGMTVFVPAGVAHTYSGSSARYLMILTPQLNELISELHTTPYDQHAMVMKKYNSDIVK